MRKEFYAGVLILIAAGSALILSLRLYHPSKYAPFTPEELRRARLRMGEDLPSEPTRVTPFPEKKVVRLAIGSLGLADEARNRQLADLVTAELSGTQGVELVDRQSIDKVLAELQMSLSGLTRAKDAVRLGKLLRAEWFLLGTSTTFAGTNSLVLRVVDARTGIFRDGAIFAASDALVGLASETAAFVRQCRKNASSGNRPVYLAIGTFEDFSINSRQTGFPTQLRGYLNAAFQNGPVTLLEREYVESLLNEVHLDMAGLTEENAASPLAPMQSAFWVVTGNYQSYDTTNAQVELDLSVARMFGATKHVRLVDRPGDPLNGKVKAAIDDIMKQGGQPIFPTRQNEVRFAMEQGEQLAGVDRGYGSPDLVYLGRASIVTWDEPAARQRKQRNVEEALRAFRTVLLLDPTNQEARLYMAACFRNETSQRFDEARDLYREVIERPIDDKWSEIARKALVASFLLADTEAKARWFEAAAAQTSSPSAAEFYGREAKTAKTELVVKGAGPEAQALAEKRLWDQMTNALLGSGGGPMGVEELVDTFGTNRIAAGARLVELYPKLRSQMPQIEPYLLAAVVSAQTDTNSPLVRQFQQLLENLIQHPDQVLNPPNFWFHVDWGIWEWSWRNMDYPLATKLLEAKSAASAVFTQAASFTNHISPVQMTDKDRMSLAIAYLGTHEWDKALPVLQSFAGQPFSMSMDGPWGRGGTVLFTDHLADYCRKKLGLYVATNKSEFQLGKPVMQLCRDQVFTVDEEGLWTAAGDRLLHFDFELKTNLILNLPLENGAAVTTICPSPTNIWIGTDGYGLIEFDKATRKFRHLSEADGLLMGRIASLYLARNELWIGYGRKVRQGYQTREGGLGKIDIRTLKSTSFMPSLAKDPQMDKWSVGVSSGPPRSSVVAITESAPGEIWCLVQGPTALVYRYHSAGESWNIPVNQVCTCLTRDSQHVFIGRYWNYFREDRTGALGVSLFDYASTSSAARDIKKPDSLPPGCVTALAIQGRTLWVGGFGYIAAIDAGSEELQSMAHIQAETVDRLAVGGGFLWAQFSCGLYRVALP